MFRGNGFGDLSIFRKQLIYQMILKKPFRSEARFGQRMTIELGSCIDIIM